MPQKNWNKYEVALLIETYQKIKQERVDKNSALVALSQNLRQMAINEGVEIDGTFRNLNGMQWQLGFIERAFLCDSYESRTPPRIFVEMVAQYKDNQEEYQSILDEAHRRVIAQQAKKIEVIEDITNSAVNENELQQEPHKAIAAVPMDLDNVVLELTEKENIILTRYSLWLLQERQLSTTTSRSYASNLRTINIYAKEHRIIACSLFDISDDKLQEGIGAILSNEEFAAYNTSQHNRFSAALHAYLIFRLGETAAGIRTRRLCIQQKNQVVICPNEIKMLLLKKFPYGIRVDSAIDIMKLKSFAEMFKVGLPESEELLKAQIAAGGISFEGKIYFVSDEVYNGIIQKINDIFSEGFSIVYYEELLSKNFDWFDKNHITSWELLQKILGRRSDGLFISKNFLRQGSKSINEAAAVEKELESVWGEEPIHTYDEMYSRLPYIPDEKIKFYLSYCKKFVWSAHETFAWIDKVIISEEEKQAIIDYAESECELKGHASIANVPLGNIEEENYQISITAIYDAVYRLVLHDGFSINGKILTKNNAGIDAFTLARTYCADKEACTFEQLNDYVISINGTENRRITFRAAYEQMIRLDEKKFVADDKVHFDINAIDSLLEQMIKGDFTSVKSIATFIMFPDCGHTWTCYLLESFCYRFSKKFRLELIGFNDRNAGIIAKKEVSLSYVDMLAVAAIRSGLDLRTDIIGEYLYANGYIARKRGSVLSNTIERAKQMKEGR